MKTIAKERRNTVLLVLEGTLFWAGLAFLQGDVVISGFIQATTGSVALVGLAATLMAFMPMVGQFIMGMVIHRVRSQSRLMTALAIIDRPLFLIVSSALLLGMRSAPSAYLFLGIYALFFLIDGAIGLLWIELCTRACAPRQRGVVISLQETFGGLVGFAAGLIVSRVLQFDWSLEHKYALIFALSGSVLLVDIVVLALLRDKPHSFEPERPIPSFSSYIKSLVPLLVQNKPARNVLIARALYMLSLISAPLNLVFGKTVGGLTDAQLATLVFMPVIGQIVAGVFWAQICNRYGYPLMMLMAEMVGVLGALMNLLCFYLVGIGVPVMVPLSITMGIIALNKPSYIGFTQQIILTAPEERRADYVVLIGLVLFPMAFGTYFAGLIVEQFGYLPVYLIMLFAGIGGCLLVFFDHFRKANAKLPQ